MRHIATKTEIVTWLKQRFALREPGKNQARLAEYLGKDKSAVTRILAGEQDITVDEFAAMMRFFGAAPDSELTEHELVGSVEMAGRIGDDVWTSCALKLTERVGAVSADYPLEEQRAYKVVEATTDGQYADGDIIFTVPFQNYRIKPAANDLIVVRAERAGLVRFSLRRARRKGITGAVVLERLGPGPAPDEDEVPVGLMIGHYRPVSRA